MASGDYVKVKTKKKLSPVEYVTSSSKKPDLENTSKVGLENGSKLKKLKLRGGQYCLRDEDENIVQFSASDKIVYRMGDSVYLDSQRPDTPHFISMVNDFTLNKRDMVMVNVKWYYRPSEVPDAVYQLLILDRNNESNDEHALPPGVRDRELFISDASDTYHSSMLRGKCKVFHFKNVLMARTFKPEQDTFFYILAYNPDTRRLNNTQGEIKIGPSHQAILPACRIYSQCEYCNVSAEELMWQPRLSDNDLMMYLHAARSMAAFIGMCDAGTPDEGYIACSQDDTTINAINVLHECQYDTSKALQTLVSRPVPLTIDQKWSEDDLKRFVKGIRQYGKNFFKIWRDYLPHKSVKQIVEYYYLWKKTPSAQGTRPHRRKRQSVLKQKMLLQRSNQRQGSCDSLSSASEDVMNSDSEDKDFGGYSCKHCHTSSSKNWHHGGPDRILLCSKCRVYFKKYGYLRCLSGSSHQSSNYVLNKYKEKMKVINNCDILNSPTSTTAVKDYHSSPTSTLSGETPFQKPVSDISSTDGGGSPPPELSDAESENVGCAHPAESSTPNLNGDMVSSSGDPQVKMDTVAPLPALLPDSTDSIADPLKQPQLVEFVDNPPETVIKPEPTRYDDTSPTSVPPPLIPDNSVGKEVPLAMSMAVKIKPEPVSPPLFVIDPRSSPESANGNVNTFSPSPPPHPIHMFAFNSKHARFILKWKRAHSVTCARTDLYYQPPDKIAARTVEEAVKPQKQEEKQERSYPEHNEVPLASTSRLHDYFPPLHDSLAMRTLSEYATRPHGLVSPRLPYHPLISPFNGAHPDMLASYQNIHNREIDYDRERHLLELRDREIRARGIADIDPLYLERVRPHVPGYSSHFMYPSLVVDRPSTAIDFSSIGSSERLPSIERLHAERLALQTPEHMLQHNIGVFPHHPQAMMMIHPGVMGGEIHGLSHPLMSHLYQSHLHSRDMDNLSRMTRDQEMLRTHLPAAPAIRPYDDIPTSVSQQMLHEHELRRQMLLEQHRLSIGHSTSALSQPRYP